MHTAHEVWLDIQNRYRQGDVFRIVDLQEDIYMLKQGDATMTSYFTKLKKLWQELKNLRPLLSCECVVKCVCLIPKVKAYIERDYVIPFLRGLNEQYTAISPK